MEQSALDQFLRVKSGLPRRRKEKRQSAKRDSIFTDKDGALLACGDTVMLKWNGWLGVPKWLSYRHAEIKDFGRTLVVVQPEQATCEYRVRMDQVELIGSILDD